MEPVFASMPGPNGPVTIRIMTRSPQVERVAGRQPFEYYRDAGIGAVQHLGGARDEIKSGGNIETIPPYEFNGTSWPAGPLILRNHGQQKHHLLPFFQAQEIQKPLLLDVDWLLAVFVDKISQFLPADSPRGWVLVADRPLAGISMLRDLKNKGHGSTSNLSRSNEAVSFHGCEDSTCADVPAPDVTIDQALANNDFLPVQQRFAERMDGNITILQEVTGLTDDEIIRLPALFKNDNDLFGGIFPDSSTSTINGTNTADPSTATVGKSKIKVGSRLPGVMNSLLMTDFNQCSS